MIAGYGLVVHDDTLPTVLGEIRPAPRAGAEITLLRQEPPRSLGMVIKERRRELGWSQEALAARVAAHGDRAFRQTDVSRLERGKIGFPHCERLCHIAAALGLSPGELLARSGWAGAAVAVVPQEPPMPATTATPDGAAVPAAVPVSR
jgi:hypothetical protein